MPALFECTLKDLKCVSIFGFSYLEILFPYVTFFISSPNLQPRIILYIYLAFLKEYFKYSFPVTKVWYFSLKVLHFSCLYFIQGAFVLLTLVRFQTVNSVTHKTIFPGRIKWWNYSPKWRHGHSFQYHYFLTLTISLVIQVWCATTLQN